MSNKKTVTLKVTKIYSTTLNLDIEVDEQLTEQKLQDYLLKYLENNPVEIELSQLEFSGEEYEYQDPNNNDGGHL